MNRYIIFTLLVLLSFAAKAQIHIDGVVKDALGNALPYASITIKGTNKGTASNNKGQYQLSLTKGEYTLVCRQVGYKTEEKKLVVANLPMTNVDFALSEQQYNLNEVVVKSNAEDPAYAIIRNAIKKRPVYQNEVKKLQCEVYIKGKLQLRNYPKKFLGETVDFEDGDTSKKKMIFLSESVANYSVDGDKRKIQVLSTRVSGNSDGFGFSSPQIISFYDIIVPMGTNINPRGFISPIASNALSYYKYKFMGSYFENGKEINRIKVIPKRKYEPLFSGYINIIEDEWRLQSVELTLVKEQQIQLLDTLSINQIYVPLKKIWVVKQQVVYPSGKIFGFDFYGNFIQVYDKININPVFGKHYFDNTLLTFLDSSNKKNSQYWDTVRPIPLLEGEVNDYKKKDSLETLRKNPHYLDSLDKVRNKITLSKLFLTGQSFEKQRKKQTISFSPILPAFTAVNTVEGQVFNFSATVRKEFAKNRTLSITPILRYGLSNTHFNPHISTEYTFGKNNDYRVTAAGGRNAFQFNNQNPIDPLVNTLATLYYTRNYSKLYEASYARIGVRHQLGGGFNAAFEAEYQHRYPLENTYSKTWRKLVDRTFTDNYPTERFTTNIVEHQAFLATASISYRPGTRYLQYPNQRINLGSKYPLFTLSLKQGLPTVLGSDVDYSAWKASIQGNLNLRLFGKLVYNTEVGGFMNTYKVFAPDYQHYLGNRTAVASKYLESFQLLPYYAYSNVANNYLTAHIEHHLNGLLTNKIPGFKKLNWFLVAGGNALVIQPNQQYYEALIGLENIFKVMRINFVQSFVQSGESTSGISFSIPLLNKQQGTRDE